MFIGTAFYLHSKSVISSIKLIFISIVLFLLFYITYRILGEEVYNSTYLNQMTYNGIYALMIFSISYIFRTKFRYNRVLGFIANISYPFYIIHSISGYIIMVILLDNGVSSLYVIPITLIILILVAYIIHKYIEMPSQKFGKNIAKLIR